MNRRPEFITFTGLDENTDLSRMRSLSACYPIEWGVLFSPKRQGREPRYPAQPFIDTLQRRTFLLHLSAHLCGAHARSVVETGEADIELAGFARVQINHGTPHEGAIASFGLRRAGAMPIAQTRDNAFPAGECEEVSWLFDRSGGTGVAPSSWPRHPGDGRLVGYAGGIGPDNVLATIHAIDSADPYWIDMESGIRTDDWLDLDKCEAVCQAVYGVFP